MEIAATAQKTKLKVKTKRFLADTVTPVSLYLRARDRFTEPVLLENNDFRSKEDCYSFMGFDTIGFFEVKNGVIRSGFPSGLQQVAEVGDPLSVPDAMQFYLQSFDLDDTEAPNAFNGLIGYTGFDGVQYFDSLNFDPEKRKMDFPDLRYNLYRFILSINHFRDELIILENIPEGEHSRMHEMENLLQNQKVSTHEFKLNGAEKSNLSDQAFQQLVTLGKKHCQLGDVFQIVFSRQFSQHYTGDDFNVYRILRSINPSPYLFYADFGQFRIFGSSPETQMAIKNGIATVNPIAGTYRRSGSPEEDAQKALDLAADPKENAEHIMLVDLARNDLGKHADQVQVKKLKDIQFFSHVIHLVSKVEGRLSPDTNPIQVFGDTFPAGTLSGAPKYKAIELINQYENQNRGFYGGALGYVGFNGDMNKAILIRSFLSHHNTLYYQAGAGIVVSSDEEKELQEVNNKLGALKKAMLEAEKLS
ncbi:MAG TPA: anthranilate synthase component I family protein [Saprospiraceae bacterium]|nr:anthranilate synthase component I family protein [Saprospiraceae bacterium]HMQ85822.1 anthranilate synthase component I family protein [Saprospiraceae bacterium]